MHAKYALVVAACAIAGCGLVPRHISLSYEPPARRQADKYVSVFVEKFTDERPRKTELCMDNSPEIFLKEGESPGNWLTAAVAEELKADGYKVTSRASDPRESVPILVEGSVRSLACGEYRGQFNPTHWAEITVAFTVHKKGTKVFDHTFNVRIGGVVHLTANPEFTNLFERAAQALLRQAIPALSKAIDKDTDGR